MKVTFNKRVSFSTLHRAFTGAGVPPIPADATMVTVDDHTVAYVADSGEAWEVFLGVGTSEMSQTFYWPDLGLCPREWAKKLVAE